MTDNLDIAMMVAGLFCQLGLVTGMKKRGNRKDPADNRGKFKGLFRIL